MLSCLEFLRISLCYRTRLAWLNSGSFLMLTNIGQKYIFFFYLETTSTQISFTCNVSVSILRKIIGPWTHFWLIERQKVWTDIVITKEHPQKLGGALIPVLKHTVLFDTRDIIFNILKCLICGLHVQQPWQTLERHTMSIYGLHVQQPWQTLERHEMSNQICTDIQISKHSL
jgi:hypothetical protein